MTTISTDPGDTVDPSHCTALVRPKTGPAILAVATGVPNHAYSQAELLALVRALIPQDPDLDLDQPSQDEALERLFAAVGVHTRHLALAAPDYLALDGFGQRSRAWIDAAQSLGERVVRAALDEAGLAPTDIDLLVTTTVTGLAVPTLGARLCDTIGFAVGIERMPLWGLGCVGGAAGIARTCDYLRAYPNRAALFLSVELCSLTIQRDDPSMANRIAAGLFGDGAAAVVLAGAEHPGATGSSVGLSMGASMGASMPSPQVLTSRSARFPDTAALMGWDIVDTGFKILLGPGVPDLVERELPGLVDSFLADHGLDRSAIATWVAHPGGPKVIGAVQTALGLDDEQVALTRDSLARWGNLSSASVLFVLDQVRRHHRPPPGSYGLLFAFGPAFCAELVLLRW